MERWSWWGLGNRPAVFPVVAAILGVVFGPGLEVPAWLWLTCSALALIGAWTLRRAGPIAMGLLAAATLGAGLAELSLDVALPPLQERVLIEGEVERVGPHGLWLEVSAVAGATTHFRAALSGESEGLVIGERVLVEAKFRPLSEAANPGEWSRAEWAWRRGQPVVGSFNRARLVRIQAAPPWRQWLANEHSALASSTHRLSEEGNAAGLLLTLSAGQRASLDEEVETSFAQSGLAHVLSVSGLHVAVLAFTLFAALRWLASRRQTRRTRVADPRAFAAPLAVPMVWAYVLFTGWQGPAVRSGVMCTLVLLAWVVRRRSDPLNAIALAALAMIAVDPSAPFDLSVQLSFCAVVSLVLLAPVLRAAIPVETPSPARFEGWALRWRRWRETVLQTICASVAVTAGSGPLVLLAFQRVSLAGVLSNVVALPLSGVLTLVAAGGAAVHVISPTVAVPLLWAGVQLSRALLLLAELFAAMPGASVALPAASAVLMIGWWLGWALLVFARGRWRWLAVVAPLSLAFHVIGPTPPDAEVRVTFLAVGHGDAMVVTSAGHSALIDGGGVPEGHDTGKRFVLPFLRRQRITRLDFAALSHAHPDHALGLISTLEEMPVDRLWLPAGVESGPLVDDVISAADDAEVEFKQAGSAGAVMGRAQFTILGPPVNREALEGENDRSLVLRVQHGEVSFLLTGDLEAAGEQQVETSPVTVVKAAHHGSSTSSTPTFVGKLKPRHVVFCVGRRNRFQFPRPEVVRRWQEAGAECHRTDVDGAITFISDGRDVRIEKFNPVGERRARR